VKRSDDSAGTTTLFILVYYPSFTTDPAPNRSLAGLGPGFPSIYSYIDSQKNKKGNPLLGLRSMSVNPYPELQSLFETALNQYKNQAGVNLLEHQLALRLTSCDDADSAVALLQEQAKAFRKFRADNGKVMMWLKRTVHVLYGLSMGVLGGGIGFVRTPSST
jgi:hypothetical protein